MKSLHPLIREKAGAQQGTATGMGHTGNDVDVKQCPAAFPMGLAPLFSVANSGAAGSARPTCAAGVSSFGFSGTMAHVIADHNGADRSRWVCRRYCPPRHPPYLEPSFIVSWFT